MPNLYFIIFEIIIYVLFALCLLQAWRAGTAKLLRLLVGAAFGLLLELATIRQLNSYQYGQFAIMVMDVPLCIGVAWSVILYSVMEFSDASTLSYWLRPALDGLLAVSIDLAMDTTAIRLGMWDWGQGLTKQYFGVPYANYWAWFWVIAFFSFGYRLLARRTDWVGRWLSAFLALLIGLVGVLATNAFITFVIPLIVYRLVITVILLLSALILVWAKRPIFYDKPVSSLVFWIPFSFHLYFGVVGMISGILFGTPILFVVSLVIFLVSLFIHQKSLPSAKQILQFFSAKKSE